jgi:hypothetical protein
MAIADLISNDAKLWWLSFPTERVIRKPQMTTKKRSSSILVLAAWIFVCIPAAWGLYNTALNAMKLFKSTAPVATTSAPVVQQSSRNSN